MPLFPIELVFPAKTAIDYVQVLYSQNVGAVVRVFVHQESTQERATQAVSPVVGVPDSVYGVFGAQMGKAVVETVSAVVEGW